MGLREDAEAARLQAIAAKEQEEIDIEENRRRALEAKRDAEEDEAREIAEVRLNVVFDPDVIWVTDPPLEKGYTPPTYLHLRSEDGVWLRYSRYYRLQTLGGVEHRWMVVMKCPVDDHWITAKFWATDLASIGRQLADAPSELKRHIRVMHPDVESPC